MAALGADMTASSLSEIHYDLATLTKSEPGSWVTMIHMTDRSTFNSVKTKVEKSGGDLTACLFYAAPLIRSLYLVSLDAIDMSTNLSAMLT